MFFFFSVSDPIGLFLQYFTKCGYYLCLLPPRLKLELVENIFSLMFASLNDLAPETPLVDVCSMEEIKKDTGVHVGRPGNLDINIDTEGLVISPFISPQHTSSNLINGNITESFQELPFNTTNNIHSTLWNSAEANYINLKHFTAGLTGFLADEIVLDSFLKMLGEQVALIKNSLHPSGFSLNDEQSLLKGVSAPISSEDFSSRVAKLSKYIFEAQWRYKVVMSNRNAGKCFLCLSNRV